MKKHQGRKEWVKGMESPNPKGRRKGSGNVSKIIRKRMEEFFGMSIKIKLEKLDTLEKIEALAVLKNYALVEKKIIEKSLNKSE